MSGSNALVSKQPAKRTRSLVATGAQLPAVHRQPSKQMADGFVRWAQKWTDRVEAAGRLMDAVWRTALALRRLATQLLLFAGLVVGLVALAAGQAPNVARTPWGEFGLQHQAQCCASDGGATAKGRHAKLRSK